MDLCLNSRYFGRSVWGHSRGTQRVARELAEIVGANVPVCDTSGLVHDVGSIVEGRDGKNGEGHHRVGARRIKVILTELGYPRSFVYQVQYCVFAHRSSQNVSRLTPEARIVASADAINHFERVGELWRVGFEDHHLDTDDVYEWLSGKLRKDWQKIMPEAHNLAREKYMQAWTTLTGLYAQA